MKLKYLLLLLATPFFLPAQSNNYKEFPDSNAVWNFHYSMHCLQNGTGNEYYSIELKGDTIINSLKYHKLHTPYIESHTSGSCNFPTIGYKGALREDVQQKKVYYIPPFETTERLLYDFNMQIGDTVEGYTQEQFQNSVNTVIAIDSVLINGQDHKRWLLNTCYDEYLIEGVGATFGLIERSNDCMTDLADFKLLCFRNGGSSIFPDSLSSCNLITSIEEKSTSKMSMEIQPNPAEDIVHLKFDGGIQYQDLRLTIHDLHGKLWKAETISSSAPLHSVSVKELETGTYIFRIRDGKGTDIVKKVVVQ